MDKKKYTAPRMDSVKLRHHANLLQASSTPGHSGPLGFNFMPTQPPEA